MATKNITITGFILNQKTKNGIANLKVEAWDKDMLLDDFVGSAVTDSKGRFVITFTRKYFIELFLDRNPDLFFKVFLGDKLVHITEETVLWNIESSKDNIVIFVVPEKMDKNEFTSKDNDLTEEESLFTFNPNLLSRKFENIKFISVKGKKYFQSMLTKALEKRILEIAGENRSSLQKIFKSKKIRYENGLTLDLNSYFIKFILPDLKKLRIPDAEIKAIQNVFESLSWIMVKDILQLDTPVKDNRIIGKAFRKMQTLEFGKIAGLKTDKIIKLAENDFDWADVNETSLFPLVKDGTLTESEKDDLLITSNLTRLTGDNLPLIKALKTPQLKTLEAFVAWESKDWIKLIRNNKITLPDGENSAETYAEYIRHNIEKKFPTKYLFAQVVKENYSNEIKLLDTVEKLQPKNEKLIQGKKINPAALNWKGISAADRKAMEKELGLLADFSNTYRRLGIPGIINDVNLEKNKKKDAIEKRLNALKKFTDNNSHFDLYHTDLLGKNNDLNWHGIDPEDQEPVKSQLLAYQRVQTLTDDYNTNETLLKKGFDSAMAIASLGADEFLEDSNLEESVAKTIYSKAKRLCTEFTIKINKNMTSIDILIKIETSTNR